MPKPIAQLTREANEIKRQAKKAQRNLTTKEEMRLEEILDESNKIRRQIDQAISSG